MTTAISVLAFLGLAAATAAQSVSATIAPNPALPGVPITITGNDTTGSGLQLPSPCTWVAIHRGSQTGPVVNTGLGCPAVLVPIASYGSFQLTWDQTDDGVPVPPGAYWLEVRTLDILATTFRTDWFCISIQQATDAALTAAGPVRVGMVTPLQISAPQEPGAIYLAAVAFSANDPISVFGLDTCLQPPIVIDLLAAPLGALDGNGNSQGLQLQIPNTPIATFQGVHVQALLAGSTLLLTNSLTFTIQP
jgi:hypothetical protein